MNIAKHYCDLIECAYIKILHLIFIKLISKFTVRKTLLMISFIDFFYSRELYLSCVGY